MIAAILLREYIGYEVDLNLVDSTTDVYQRLAKVKSAAQGPALLERVDRGESSFGYANLEVWPEGKHDMFVEIVGGRKAADLGTLGLEGREGWFVPASFAHDPAYSGMPEFYRAYDTRRGNDSSVLQALRQRFTVNCVNAPCCCSSVVDCPSVLSGSHPADLEVQWCPWAVDERLPAVLVPASLRQLGLQEELARSNGFRFALRFLGEAAFARLATDALVGGAAQLVHTWRPSLLLARLDHLGVRLSRVMLPTEDCGVHLSNGTGTWACDMPRQALQKLASLEVNSDPVARDFLRHFQLPQSRSTDGVAEVGTEDASLAGAGMQELLASFVRAADGAARPETPEEVFATACSWVRGNEAVWRSWVKPRSVPFFADTLAGAYPLPIVVGLLILAIAYIVGLEWAWLGTSLSPLTVRRLLEKNAGRGWRSSLDQRLRRSLSPQNGQTLGKKQGSYGEETPPSSPQKQRPRTYLRSYSEIIDPSEHPSLETQRYWEGMDARAEATPELAEFWQEVEQRFSSVKKVRETGCTAAEEALEAGAAPPPEDTVRLARHVFPCLERNGVAVVMLCRSLKGAFSRGSLTVEVSVEASDGGGDAKPGKDFKAGMHQAVFPPGVEFAVLHIPIVHHATSWHNTCWFRVRLVRVVEGEAALAAPAKAKVLILNDNRWPHNLPDTLRDGLGVNLMQYFIAGERARRGEKWRKTMLAMLWIPVHPVLVSTLVQKLLVDHAAHTVLLDGREGSEMAAWPYYEVLLLVLLQLFSLGLNRWADVVQVRNRGRTGGIRAVHRTNLMRKFIFLEHAEHWFASEASWLYSGMQDVDIITTHAYWEVFILAQSCFALLLSVGLILVLAAQGMSTGIQVSMLLYPLGVFLIIPLGVYGVWLRRKLLWLVVIARKSSERDWFRGYTWVISHWREFAGVLFSELVSLDKGVNQAQSKFVPLHWDARDSLNDTAWITHWVQGIAYCFMLLLGSFALVEYQTYGIGAMEVGTFYAFCKVYLGVGKYVGRLAGVFVNMQQAVVSLRELAALMNLTDHSSMRREVQLWSRLGKLGGGAPPGYGLKGLVLEEGLCFLRPAVCKSGSLYGELRLARRCELPLGHVVGLQVANERVLRSILALISQVLQPTGPGGEELPEGAPRVLTPPHLDILMVQSMPTNFQISSSSIEEQLGMTGASSDLCTKLARCLGLDPSREVSTLGPGSRQVFSLLRVLLADPDVMVTFRPLNLVPADVRHKVMVLLRVWQACGGLPALSKLIGLPPPKATDQPEGGIYRSSVRTIIIGNPDDDLWEGVPPEVKVDVDRLLWKGDLRTERSCSAYEDDSRSQVYTGVGSESMLLRPVGCHPGCFGLWTNRV